MQRLVSPTHPEAEHRLFFATRVKNGRISGVGQPHELPQREAALQLRRRLAESDKTRVETLDCCEQAQLPQQMLPCVEDED